MAADRRPVTLDAPAKLTCSLRLTGVRNDGFHLVDAEMVALDLVDTIELVELPAGTPTTVDVVDARTGTPVTVGPLAQNLVTRALALLGRSAEVHIVKRIPAGAGLGGGSSDAAAVLRWGGWRDLDAAAGLGADVAFCLVGGRAIVRGIGEQVEPQPFEPRTFTLLTPPFGCSTVEVYRAWDRLGGPRGEGRNDLVAAALAVEPRLAAWRDRLGDATGQEPQLAGSGSTWFVEGDFPGDDRVVAHSIPAPG